MFVTVQIPDEVYQVYAARKPERPQVAIADTLKEFAGRVPGEQRIIFEGEELRELKHAVEWPVSTVGELLEHLHRAGRVTLGEGLEVLITPAQRQRLSDQAAFWRGAGEAPEPHFRKWVTDMVQEALSQVVGL